MYLLGLFVEKDSCTAPRNNVDSVTVLIMLFSTPDVNKVTSCETISNVLARCIEGN